STVRTTTSGSPEHQRRRRRGCPDFLVASIDFSGLPLTHSQVWNALLKARRAQELLGMSGQCRGILSKTGEIRGTAGNQDARSPGARFVSVHAVKQRFFAGAGGGT